MLTGFTLRKPVKMKSRGKRIGPFKQISYLPQVPFKVVDQAIEVNERVGILIGDIVSILHHLIMCFVISSCVPPFFIFFLLL